MWSWRLQPLLRHAHRSPDAGRGNPLSLRQLYLGKLSLSSKKDKICEDFPDILYQRRSALGLSKADIAELLGVTESAVGHWENGKHRPPARKMTLLAKLLQMSEAELKGDVPLSIETKAPMTFNLPAFLQDLDHLISAAERVRSALRAIQGGDQARSPRRRRDS